MSNTQNKCENSFVVHGKDGKFPPPGHDTERLQFSNRNVEVMFLPPITTSILQPIGQGRIKTFKS
jgi:hypothetical protein